MNEKNRKEKNEKVTERKEQKRIEQNRKSTEMKVQLENCQLGDLKKIFFAFCFITYVMI